MNKLIVSLMLLGVAMGAQAQAPAPAAPVQDQGKTPEVTTVAADHAKAPDRHCLPDTGTRIRKDGKTACVYSAGKWYTHEDIERTGATNIADALRMLDPSISVGGH